MKLALYQTDDLVYVAGSIISKRPYIGRVCHAEYLRGTYVYSVQRMHVDQSFDDGFEFFQEESLRKFNLYEDLGKIQGHNVTIQGLLIKGKLRTYDIDNLIDDWYKEASALKIYNSPLFLVENFAELSRAHGRFFDIQVWSFPEFPEYSQQIEELMLKYNSSFHCSGVAEIKFAPHYDEEDGSFISCSEKFYLGEKNLVRELTNFVGQYVVIKLHINF